MDGYLPILTERGRRWARFLGLIALAALLCWIAVVLRRVLTPVVAAMALAYILNPLITLIEKRYQVRRAFSIGCGLVLLIIIGAILLLAASIQIVQFAGNVPYYTQQTMGWIDQTIPGLLEPVRAQPDKPESQLKDESLDDNSSDDTATQAATQTQPSDEKSAAQRAQLLKLASQHGIALGQAALGYITNLLSDLFYWLSLIVLLPLYTFFFLLNFNTITATIHDHLPADYRPTIVRVVQTIDSAISSFFRGRLLICMAVGLLTGFGWLGLGLFGIHVPYNLALGVLVGILNLVPFMSVLGLPPAIILTFIDADAADENWLVAISAVFIVYAIVQAIESFVLTPTIGAKAAGLHPVTTVIVLMIGGQLIGFLGMLLAIPLASTLKSLFAEYLLPEIRRLAKAEPATAGADDSPRQESP